MKLATLNDGSPDGVLVVVSRDLHWCVPCEGIARTLQDALERWAEVHGALQELADTLLSGARKGHAFNPKETEAPMPRSWQWLDGSAFKSHGDLMSTVFKTEKLGYERPLMYQGLSHRFLSGYENVPMVSEADGIDFEGEFAIITDFVPIGTTAGKAVDHIKLVVLLNDWSLRTLAPIEMKTGFGWIQAKPACSMAPVAVTVDELGPAWVNSRVALDLWVSWNDVEFGHPNGSEMAFGFSDLIAHAARTRDLCAGTVIGSGTVSNEAYRTVGSCCIAERRGIEIVDEGEPKTNFMKYGDEVSMQVRGGDGALVFGEIRQKVVAIK